MTTPIRHTLALSALALSLASGAAPAQEGIGVTAAANRQADVERGAARRTVTIGDDVAFRDRIVTSETGLVQVLFVDGSAFTVGANSQVVIDEFVYNPATGAGAITSEITRGALRFVGGRVSKGANPVRFRTPVGTLGVRGAIVDIDLAPGCLRDGRCPSMVAALVFGNELTLDLPGGGRNRIYERGHALVVFGQGAQARAEVVRLDEIDLAGVRQRLAGQRGQRGGAPRGPTEAEVAESGVPAVNSARPPEAVRPRPRREVVTTIGSTDDDTPGIATVSETVGRTVSEGSVADTVRDAVIDGADPTFRGTLSGLLATPGTYTTANGAARIRAPWSLGIAVPGIAGLPEITVNESAPGVPVSVEIGDVTLNVPAEEGEVRIAPRTSAVLGAVRGGAILRGPGGFGFYFLDLDPPGDRADTALTLMTGTPTPRDVFYPAPSPGAAARPATVRTYTLGTDYARAAQGIRSDAPLLNPLVAQAFGNRFLAAAAETPFFVIEKSDLTPSATTLYAALAISGTGRNQRSMIVSDAGIVFASLSSGADALGIGGSRRGSFRLDGLSGPVFMRGGTGSAQIANDDRFTAIAGPNGEAFVYSSGVGDVGLSRNGRSDEVEFIDVTLDDPLQAPAAPDRYSSMLVPAFLAASDPTTAYDRRTATVFGFAAGMVETEGGGAAPFRSVTSGDVEMRFDAAAATMGARLSVFDTTDASSAAGFQFGAGFDVTGTHPAASSGRSAYLDWTRFAANSTGPANDQGGDSTLLFPDRGDAPIAHRPYTGPFGTGADPGTYVVSSGLVPQPGLFRDAEVTPCTCEFMQWGWWGTQTEFVDNSLPGGRRRDIVHLGTWATADIPRTDELPTTGSGTFTGHAIGSVSAAAGEGRAQYVAVGDMTMTFDFAARIGSLEIDNFDGRNFSGTMAGISGGPDRNLFGGSLAGSGLEGTATGAFARGPEGPAQGVLGSFDVGGAGYSATGTFMGER